MSTERMTLGRGRVRFRVLKAILLCRGHSCPRKAADLPERGHPKDPHRLRFSDSATTEMQPNAHTGSTLASLYRSILPCLEILRKPFQAVYILKIGRASCRERR